MTLAAASPIITYTGSSSANSFSFPYPTYAQNDLVVTVKNLSTLVISTLILGTDYTVSGLNASGSPASSSGLVTLISASQAWLSGGNLATGYSLTIERVVSIAQLTSIRDQGDFYPETIEDSLDYLTMICQQLEELILIMNGAGTIQVNSSIVVPVGISATGVTLANGNTYLVHTLIGAFTLNLPAPASGMWFFIKDADQNASTNNITVHRNAAEKIDGVASDLTLPASNGCWLIASDGTNWYSLATTADLVLNDISNGHTYRVLMRAGVLSTQMVR